MNVSVIGCGYVGLVAAVCLAKLGHRITLVDVDEQKIEMLNNCQAPIHEPDVEEALSQSDLEVTSDYDCISNSDLILLCVSTPTTDDGFISLEYITQASEQLAQVLKKKLDYCVVVVKSTVVPGTTTDVVIPILEKSGKKAGIDFGVCMVPEFLAEGKAIYDFMNPMRIVIGEYDTRSGDMASQLYQSLGAPILRTNPITAEMIKYASNTFLATKISFINEIGNICKLLGIDTYEVARGMGADDRIGSKFLNAGLGFGGSCLPKDIKALISRVKQMGYEPRILEEVWNLNEHQGANLVALLKKHILLKGSTVGLLGLAFKPETDDIRESRAIRLVKVLLKEGATIRAYDPAAVENFKCLFPQIEYVSSQKVLASDAIIIVTEWEEFSHLDYRGKIVIDGRRVPKAMEAKVYEGLCW
ncbi:UDP-glucose dehydrogenase family protein [Chloroflexota bacterium]